jgi:hypothetical protein
VSSPEQGIWGEGEAWALRESLRIGALEGDGPELFGEIGDVAVDGEGRIYVLEEQAHEIRVFGPDGSHLRTIGRQGGGPGELNVPFGGEIEFDPTGRLVVHNSMNRRWEIFTPEGESVGSTPIQTSYFGSSTVRGTDGALYMRDGVRTGEGGERQPVVIRREVRGDSLTTTDTLPAPPLPEREAVELTANAGGNTMTALMPVPFVHQPSWQFHPEGHFWVEPGDGYRLVALDLDHDTLRIVERAYTPVPVTEAEVEEALEPFSSGPFAGSDAAPSRSRIPDHHPPMGTFRVDDPTGHLWVLRTLGPDLYAWDVFDPRGRYLGEVETEVELAALSVHAITADAVYGVLTGELDEPYVVRLALEKGG